MVEAGTRSGSPRTDEAAAISRLSDTETPGVFVGSDVNELGGEEPSPDWPGWVVTEVRTDDSASQVPELSEMTETFPITSGCKATEVFPDVSDWEEPDAFRKASSWEETETFSNASDWAEAETVSTALGWEGVVAMVDVSVSDDSDVISGNLGGEEFEAFPDVDCGIMLPFSDVTSSPFGPGVDDAEYIWIWVASLSVPRSAASSELPSVLRPTFKRWATVGRGQSGELHEIRASATGLPHASIGKLQVPFTVSDLGTWSSIL